MSKGKPRHNPDKKQNKYGGFCSYYEVYPNGTACCEVLYGDAKICKGNPHNCVKCKYKKLAICDTKNPKGWG